MGMHGQVRRRAASHEAGTVRGSCAPSAEARVECVDAHDRNLIVVHAATCLFCCSFGITWLRVLARAAPRLAKRTHTLTHRERDRKRELDYLR